MIEDLDLEAIDRTIKKFKSLVRRKYKLCPKCKKRKAIGLCNPCINRALRQFHHDHPRKAGRPRTR